MKKKAPVSYAPDRTVEEHEAYGLIHFARVTGNVGPLYGTPIRAHGGVCMTLKESHKEFDHVGGERHVGGKVIAECMMSAVQFAEAITTMNMGEGVPVTLQYVRPSGYGLDECERPPEQESEAKQIRESFNEQVAEKRAAMKSMKRHISKILQQGKVSKARIESIEYEINQFFRLFDDTAPFMMGTFEESVEKTVANAKTEISAFASMIAEKTGIEALKQGDEPTLLKEGTER
jgi:hypothetical protein